MTNRAEQSGSQDAFAVLDSPGAVGVVVADGVGGLPRSAEAARVAVATVTDLWEGFSDADLSELFTAAHRKVLENVGGAGATTLLVALTRGEKVEVAWVGNGAVVEIRLTPWQVAGRPAPLPERSLAGLVWVNHLLPDVSYCDGRDRLNRVVGGVVPPVPNRIVLGHLETPGALMVCTDGIFSAERCEVGEDEQADAWGYVGAPLAALLEAARALLADTTPPDREDPGAAVNGMIARCLHGLGEQDRLHDDTTVAALVRRAVTGP